MLKQISHAARLRAAGRGVKLLSAVTVASAAFATPAMAADSTAPTAPATLQAVAGSGTVSLAWKASMDNVGVTGYNVWRRLAAGTSWQRVTTVTGTSFADAALTNGTSYVYGVRAKDAAGNVSAASPFAQATPQYAAAPAPAPAPAPAGRVLWTADAEKPFDQEWGSINDLGINGGLGTVSSAGMLSRATRSWQTTGLHAQGAAGYKFTVKAADRDPYNTSTRQRTEIGMSNPSKTMADGVDRVYRNGADVWMSWQMYLPTNFTLAQASNSVLQWKQIGTSQYGGGGNPALNLDASANAWRMFRAGDIAGNSALIASLPALKNVWSKFSLHVKFSADPSIGFVEWYGDNGDGRGMRTILPKYMTWTMKRDGSRNGDPLGAGNPLPSHTRLGIYRAVANQDSDMYADGYTVATTRAAAEATAFTP